ncbi:MAG: radical SAM protein [Elusimicrobia bacterium]|nr:radical SAM protein [Elusimicrobiota bacterium]
MKIKFVNAMLGGDFSALDIAITVLATAVNKGGAHRATITDLTFHRRHWQEHLAQEIAADAPDLIAISTNTMYMQYVAAVAEEVKRRHGLPVLLGGHHAARFPEATARLPYCDWVIAGDAERSLPAFLDRIAAGGRDADVRGIPGIRYRRGQELLGNPDAAFTAELDSLPPPDWDLWKDLDRYFYYLQMLYVIGSRGCPYQCSYCDAVGIKNAVQGKYYRQRDPRAFARELQQHWEKYRRRGFKLAQIFDPVFTLDKKWLSEFCSEYKALGLDRKLGYSVFSRVDNLDDEKIEMLGDSGCALLRVGVEAGDDYIRNEIYGKKISSDKIREIFRKCRAKGIRFTAFYILGGPGESRATMDKTIALARELQAERSAFFIYKPFTELGERQIIEHGGWIDKRKWAAADNITFGSVVESPNYSTRLVEWYQAKAYFWTFGRRLLGLLRRHPVLYPWRLAVYLGSGIFRGLDCKYLLVYYHIYSYDNVDR